MPSLAGSLSALLDVLVPFALEGSILALFILAMRAVFGRMLGARFQALLWMMFTIRLCLFWLPWPRVSVPVRPPVPHVQARAATPAIAPLPAVASPPATGPLLQARGPAYGGAILAGLWLLGTGFFFFRLVRNHARVWRHVRHAPVVTDARVMSLLEACKAELRVHTPLVIQKVVDLPSPALVGLMRPRLLLDEALLESLSEEELRHVLLHELIHLRRWDILWAWLSAWVQVAQWFNPVLWWAFRRMHQDRELACDASVLSVLPAEDAPAYGRTLLKTFERLRPPRFVPALAGLAEDRSNLSRRIHMITLFQPFSRSHKSRLLGGLVLAGCAGVLLFSLRLFAGSPQPLAQPIVDKIDVAFVVDPEVLGGWRTVDFVKDPATFKPDHPQLQPEQFFVKDFYFLPEGKTKISSAVTWTKGLVLSHGDRTASRYEIQTIQGRTFLFMEWKSGDYTFFGKKPAYYVFEKDDRVSPEQARRRDKTDFPFADEAALHGAWKTVDLVRTIQAFNSKKTGRPQFFDGITFYADGTTSKSYTWTKGLILHRKDETASRYEIRQIDGKEYLFFEFKNGDYVFAGREPKWFVLERSGKE